MGVGGVVGWFSNLMSYHELVEPLEQFTIAEESCICHRARHLLLRTVGTNPITITIHLIFNYNVVLH
jgi:hypothetical protein